MAVVRKEIGDLLVDNGVITDEELDAAKVEREKTGDSIVGILSKQGLANESQVKNALELQYGVNFVTLMKSKTPPTPESVALLTEEVMRLHQLVCISQQGDRVTVAMVDPSDVSAAEDLKGRLKGMQIKTVVCLEDDLEQFLNNFFAKETPEAPITAPVAVAATSAPAATAVAEKAAEKPTEKPERTMSLLERITASQRKSALTETSEIPRKSAEAAGDLAVEVETPPVMAQKDAHAQSAVTETYAAPAEAMESKVEPESIKLEELETVSTENAQSLTTEEAPKDNSPIAAVDPATEAVLASVNEQAVKAAQKIASENQRQHQYQASKSPTLMGMTAMVVNDSETELAKRAQEEAIVLLANQILSSAIKRHCSNIHIIPGDREGSVNYRLDGTLYVDRKLPKTILTPIVARYKMMARMNLAERNICQDGHIKVKSSAKEIVCLVSVIPTQHGEHVSIWIV